MKEDYFEFDIFNQDDAHFDISDYENTKKLLPSWDDAPEWAVCCFLDIKSNTWYWASTHPYKSGGNDPIQFKKGTRFEAAYDFLLPGDEILSRVGGFEPEEGKVYGVFEKFFHLNRGFVKGCSFTGTEDDCWVWLNNWMSTTEADFDHDNLTVEWVEDERYKKEPFEVDCYD